MYYQLKQPNITMTVTDQFQRAQGPYGKSIQNMEAADSVSSPLAIHF